MAGQEAPTGSGALAEIIRHEIARGWGRIPFARFMELALYHPQHGYYLAADRRPGRGGDFITSPEASAFFGLTLARQIAECWERLGRPLPFDIREYGSGIGVLAYDILAGLSEEAPVLFEQVRYRMVEPNRHRRGEALGALAEVDLLSKVVVDDPARGLPPITGAVLANEVADALPVHRLVGVEDGFRELWVVTDGEGFAWREGELSPGGEQAAEHLERSGIVPAPGALYDASPASAAWFAEAVRDLARGYAILIDYGYPARELYRDHRLEGTIRAHRAHTVTDDPFGDPGRQDLTAHVDFTALQWAGEREGLKLAGITTQADFLAALGLGERLVAMQKDPTATIADYLSAQAVVLRLIDPGGLGRFRVLIMAKDAPTIPPLLGLQATDGPVF